MKKDNDNLSRETLYILENVFKNLQSGISILDKDFTILLANPWLEERCADSMPLKGKKCYGVYWGRKTICPWCPSAEALRSGEVVTKRMPYQYRDTPPIWIEITAVPFKEKDGFVKGVIEYVKDVTASQAKEEELRRSERFLSSMFDCLRGGISVLDRELTIIRVNKWVEKMYADQMPLLGKKCYNVYQKMDSPCGFCPSEKVISEGGRHVSVIPYPSAEKPERWFELSASPLTDSENKTIGVIEHIIDITESKKAKERLQQNVRDLERFKAVAVDRENQMIELKKRVNQLSKELGRKEPYDLSFLK